MLQFVTSGELAEIRKNYANQVNSDNHIESSIRLEEWVRTTIESTLERATKEDLTRVEVYLRDENGDKPGPHDFELPSEARPKGHQPVSVCHKANPRWSKRSIAP